MVIREEFTVQKPMEQVWEFLQDVPRLATCVPGVEAVEMIEPNRYRGRLAVRVGPIATSFEGLVRIIRRIPPMRIEAEIEGQDRVSGSGVKAFFIGILEPREMDTRLSCELQLSLRGRLAQFGSAIIEATARRTIEEFARRLRQALEEAHER
jgi:carbon monoxide dehydrogenase subunit G